jgi:hypothetical protein
MQGNLMLLSVFSSPQQRVEPTIQQLAVTYKNAFLSYFGTKFACIEPIDFQSISIY